MSLITRKKHTKPQKDDVYTVCVCVLSRWSEVKHDLTHTSLSLQTLLQAWKRYSDLSTSYSEKLQHQKVRLCDISETKASKHDNDTETLATCIQRLHVSSVGPVKKEPVYNVPFITNVVDHMVALLLRFITPSLKHCTRCITI